MGLGKRWFYRRLLLVYLEIKINKESLPTLIVIPGWNLKTTVTNQINILGTPQFQPLTSLVAYGSSRLEIQNQPARNEISTKSTTTYGLFNTDGILLTDIPHTLWYNKKLFYYLQKAPGK